MARTGRRKERRPRCLLIAGPNGAGKTTFAREYLPNDARMLNFVNADLIASGLSPLRPELAAVAAARLTLDKVVRLFERRADFEWESTLSGLANLKRLQTARQLGYRTEIIYLQLESPQLALNRIAARVRQGGHHVPRIDVLRRFSRSWANFGARGRSLADAWVVYDNSSRLPKLVESGSARAMSENRGRISSRDLRFAIRIERALLRAGDAARCTARMYRTPLYVWENGEVVAKRP